MALGRSLTGRCGDAVVVVLLSGKGCLVLAHNLRTSFLEMRQKQEILIITHKTTQSMFNSMHALKLRNTTPNSKKTDINLQLFIRLTSDLSIPVECILQNIEKIVSNIVTQIYVRTNRLNLACIPEIITERQFPKESLYECCSKEPLPYSRRTLKKFAKDSHEKTFKE